MIAITTKHKSIADRIAKQIKEIYTTGTTGEDETAAAIAPSAWTEAIEKATRVSLYGQLTTADDPSLVLFEFKNGWSTSPLSPAYCWFDGHGLKRLSGSVQKFAAVVDGEIIASLPREFWPTQPVDFLTPTSAGVGRCQINISGNIIARTVGYVAGTSRSFDCLAPYR